MSNELVPSEPGGDLAIYDPEKGLEAIAVAEAAEKHFARAKDARQLLKALELKLKEIREFVRWWDGLGEKRGGDKRSKNQRDSTVTLMPVAGRGGMPERKVIERWRRRTKDDEAFARALEDARHRVQRISDLENANTIRGTEGTGEYERYTPARYIGLVREVLGEIDLDPATSEKAQDTVQASDFFVEEENGLEREWNGRVFLNPPYHRDLAPKFLDKLVAEYGAGRISAAIVLTNNCTDTEWFDDVMRITAGLCFTHGRIRFIGPDGAEQPTPTQGQTFFYLGDDVQRFEDVFCVIGFCVKPSRQYESCESCEVDGSGKNLKEDKANEGE